MAKMMKVVKVEMRETVTERVIKTKRHDYVRGGYYIEETIVRTKRETPFALLECGHWQEQYPYGAEISKAKRIYCHKCRQIEWNRLREQGLTPF